MQTDSKNFNPSFLSYTLKMSAIHLARRAHNLLKPAFTPLQPWPELKSSQAQLNPHMETYFLGATSHHSLIK